MDCESGGLTVTEGSSMRLGRYCGQRFSWSLVSDGSELTLRLSDVPWMTGTHRITLEYEAIGMSTMVAFSSRTKMKQC